MIIAKKEEEGVVDGTNINRREGIMA